MRRLEPLGLLLIVGLLLGTIFPLGTLAQQNGVSAALYTFMAAAGAGCVLACLTVAFGLSLRPDRAAMRFSFVAGLLTFAIPWGCVIVVMPRTGSALPAVVQSLTPIATVAIVCAMALERPRPAVLAGLAIGLAGVLFTINARTVQPGAETVSLGWLLATLITPITLAIGNVYRSTNWPSANNHPLQLATWSLLSAAVVLGCVVVLQQSGSLTAQFAAGWPFFMIQALATGLGYACFFRLQRIGGSIYVSQLSFVNTIAGVLFAVTLLSETLPMWSWVAMGVVFIGVLIVGWTR